jgi:uncharacterized protein YqiB (DUF1249 family)
MPQRNKLSIERSHREDLTDLHALCDANYRRVLQLFPDYEQRNDRRIAAADAEVTLEVTDRGRYTTALRVTLSGVLPAPLGVSSFELRVYHDARMAEVIAFQSQRTGAPRFRYPNPQMHQRNEKLSQNQFAADLLSFCLAEGRVTSLPLLHARDV